MAKKLIFFGFFPKGKVACPSCKAKGVFSRKVYRFCDMKEIEKILLKCKKCGREWLASEKVSPATYPAPYPPPH